MKILMVGDVIGQNGIDYLKFNLRAINEDNKIDFCIVNGENSTDYHGITRRAFEEIYDAGADVVTLGNHTWHKKDVFSLLESGEPIIRPHNFPVGAPGSGVWKTKVAGRSVAVVNLIGRTFMEAVDCPFGAADAILEQIGDTTDIIIVDFHAEATSEKVAMGYYLDGRVSAVFGTHTHIQTADEKVLPKGTAYITDIGMTGPYYSVLGMERSAAIARFVTKLPQQQRFADGKMQFNAVIVTLNDDDNKVVSIERVNLCD